MTTIGDMVYRARIVWLLVIAGLSPAVGAPWGEALGNGARRDEAAGESERFWSFQPVRHVVPPPVRAQDWPQSPIDRFILARLEEQGLGPAEPGDRRTLLRRATFDLTGLPPTPAEIKEFLADESPDAFARVVDRLLASPRYGERWGRHWLDVVRYADARDLIQLPAESDFREAWRYRDWVVAAFNRDLPYDEFITRQLAGDLLQPADPARIDADGLVATGMLAIADFVPGDVDKQQMIADYVNDQIDVVGRAFLGLTLACARCHDHKFDPISTEDYYSLAGIFFSTRLIPGPVKGNTPLLRVPLLSKMELEAIESGQERDKVRLTELSRQLATLADREYRTYLERRVDGDAPRYLQAAWEFTHPAAGEQRPTAAEFAKARGLDEPALARWVRYFDEAHPHPALAALRAATERAASEQLARELGSKLSQLATERRVNGARESVSRALAESEVLRFRADDRRIVTNDAREVTILPNRGHAPEDATPVADVAPPTVTTATINGHARSVLRFSGKEMLQAPGSVPAVGSLFVVFRPDPAGGAGQRLVGWEDSAVGQHGVGIMTDGAGSVHAILRRNAANGDVVVPAPTPAPAMPEFQVLCISWGPSGVAVHRNGQAAGANKGIDSVSSDPAITALRIGGPGSGSSTRFQGDLAELRVFATQVDDEARANIEADLTKRWRSPPPEHPETSDPVADLYDELISPQSPFRLESAERDKSLPQEFRTRYAALRDELEQLKKKTPPDIPRAVVVQDGGPPGTPHEGFHDAQVYLRGNHATPGKTVPRGFPRALAGVDQPPIREGSGRRELAHWLTRPDNPLTARVMVNRIWQHHFGAGLVRTSANFGAMGERPSHPELLDYLAERFVASGWSIKAMHRLIMLSSTYQQSARPSVQALASDPENRLFSRANRRRLEAEAVRDSLFDVAGRSDSTAGGLGFQDLATPRRSIYLMSVRTGAKTAEFGPLFDAPDCSGIVERRSESIVAPQALFLMNDPLVAELAKGLAQRVAGEVPAGNDRERIERLHEITVGRPPAEAEVVVALRFLGGGVEEANGVETPTLAASATEAWVRYCHLVICSNEFMYVD